MARKGRGSQVVVLSGGQRGEVEDDGRQGVKTSVQGMVEDRVRRKGGMGNDVEAEEEGHGESGVAVVEDDGSKEKVGDMMESGHGGDGYGCRLVATLVVDCETAPVDRATVRYLEGPSCSGWPL